MSLSAAAGVKKVSASLKLPKGDFNACSRVFTNQLADTASDHFHFSRWWVWATNITLLCSEWNLSYQNVGVMMMLTNSRNYNSVFLICNFFCLLYRNVYFWRMKFDMHASRFSNFKKEWQEKKISEKMSTEICSRN